MISGRGVPGRERTSGVRAGLGAIVEHFRLNSS